MPRNQQEVPAALKDLRLLLRRQQAEVQATQGLIKAVQSLCDHPKKTYHPDGYGDGGDTRCDTCDALC